MSRLQRFAQFSAGLLEGLERALAFRRREDESARVRVRTFICHACRRSDFTSHEQLRGHVLTCRRSEVA